MLKVFLIHKMLTVLTAQKSRAISQHISGIKYGQKSGLKTHVSEFHVIDPQAS